MAKLNADERKRLDDSEFGIPSKRAFPLNDPAHVYQAIRMFTKSSVKDRDELARNIIKAMKKFKLTVSRKSSIASYLKNNEELLREDKELFSQDNHLSLSARNDKKVLNHGIMLTDKLKHYSYDHIFIDSDVHLNTTEKLLAYEKNQRNTVTNDDVFIFLGDIVSDNYSDELANMYYQSIAKWNGRIKIMICGNNDVLGEEFYINQCKFNIFTYSARLDEKYIFTHVPIKDKYLINDEINIHGHIHEGNYWDQYYNPTTHINVFSQLNGMKPISLETLLENNKDTRLFSESMDYLNSLVSLKNPIEEFDNNSIKDVTLRELNYSYDYYKGLYDVYLQSNNVQGMLHLFDKVKILLNGFSIANREPWLDQVKTYYDKTSTSRIKELLILHTLIKQYLFKNGVDLDKDKNEKLMIDYYTANEETKSKFKDEFNLHEVFEKVKSFYKNELGVDLSYMQLKLTNKVYKEDGTINDKVPTNWPNKGEGDWTKLKIVYFRPTQFKIRTQHMDDLNRKRYAAQVMAHELAHECYHNNLLDLKEKNIPISDTEYINSFDKGSDHFKEEQYADSLGNYISQRLYK